MSPVSGCVVFVRSVLSVPVISSFVVALSALFVGSVRFWVLSCCWFCTLFCWLRPCCLIIPTSYL